MSKLRGAKKEAFLKRMAAGRRKAARGNPKTKRKTRRAKMTAAQKLRLDVLQDKVIRRGSGEIVSRATGQRLSTAAAKKYGGHKRANAGPRSVRKSKKAMKRLLPGFHRKAKGRRRRNQEEGMGGAEQMYEAFHGKPSGKTTEYALSVQYPAQFAELGRLKELRFDLDTANRDFPLTHFKDCEVVCTPDGGNIYFIGGDQSLSLEDLDIASDKDFVELGPCGYIMYHTRKGFHDFEPIDYFHRFGEEDGILPLLVYDRLNRALFLASGNYRVRADGIEN
jgi:hypothetical protein